MSLMHSWQIVQESHLSNSYKVHGLAQNIKQMSNYSKQTQPDVNKPL